MDDGALDDVVGRLSSIVCRPSSSVCRPSSKALVRDSVDPARQLAGGPPGSDVFEAGYCGHGRWNVGTLGR